jgi:hypothetical protein
MKTTRGKKEIKMKNNRKKERQQREVRMIELKKDIKRTKTKGRKGKRKEHGNIKAEDTIKE